MITTLLILFSLYFICMLALVFGFSRVPVFSSEVDSPATLFSVVIPFRNEAENFPALLKSICNLKYPSELFEIIFVNDSSEDTSAEIILEVKESSSFSIRLIQNKRISNSPKKDAITEAINNAKFDWVVTTDADCELPENWFKTLDSFIQFQSNKEKIPMMVCAPILYKSDGSFLEIFQYLDGLSLQAVTIGSFGLNNPILSNGANLAYRKEAFEKVNGYSENNHIASGDDIFLMEKMKKTFPGQLKFLKSNEVVVVTKPQSSWKEVIEQRIRWASKTSKQKSPFSLFLGLLVFLVNLAFLILPVLLVLYPESWIIIVFLFFFKILVDFIVIRQAGSFFDKRISLWQIHWMSFVYAPIMLVVVLGSLSGSYSWKDRNY